MKRILFFNPIELLPYVVFLIGLAFFVFHLPYADIVLLCSAPFALLTYLFLHLLHKDKSAVWVKLLLGISKALWLFYFSSKVLFWTNSNIIFYITVVFSVATIILSVYKKQLVVMQGILLIVLVAVGIFFMGYPNHKLFYVLNMSSDAKQNPDDYGYKTWDRYSWFLYKGGLFDDALDANYFAHQSAVNESKSIPIDNSIFVKIADHKQKIEQRNWDEFEANY